MALALASLYLVAASSLALGKPGEDDLEQAALAAPHAATELVVTYEDGAFRTAVPPIEEEDARVAEELPEVGAEVVEFAAMKEDENRASCLAATALVPFGSTGEGGVGLKVRNR